MTLTFRPIERWPREFTKGRRRSPFKGDYLSTMRLLERELRNAAARDPIVQLALLPSEFRIDGRPYADARPQHPGVVLSFTKGKLPLAFPCDTYVTWIENLRAIALALDALRRVERYGVTKHAEQYRGWNALPPATALVTPPKMTLEQAANLLCKEGGPVGDPLRSGEEFQRVYRLAAKKNHPDVNRGVVSETWQRIQEAAALLRTHHGL